MARSASTSWWGTKSSLCTDDLRDRESGKIKCGKAHFGKLTKFNEPVCVGP